MLLRFKFGTVSKLSKAAPLRVSLAVHCHSTRASRTRVQALRFLPPSTPQQTTGDSSGSLIRGTEVAYHSRMFPQVDGPYGVGAVDVDYDAQPGSIAAEFDDSRAGKQVRVAPLEP